MADLFQPFNEKEKAQIERLMESVPQEWA